MSSLLRWRTGLRSPACHTLPPTASQIPEWRGSRSASLRPGCHSFHRRSGGNEPRGREGAWRHTVCCHRSSISLFELIPPPIQGGISSARLSPAAHRSRGTYQGREETRGSPWSGRALPATNQTCRTSILTEISPPIAPARRIGRAVRPSGPGRPATVPSSPPPCLPMRRDRRSQRWTESELERIPSARQSPLGCYRLRRSTSTPGAHGGDPSVKKCSRTYSPPPPPRLRAGRRLRSEGFLAMFPAILRVSIAASEKRIRKDICYDGRRPRPAASSTWRGAWTAWRRSLFGSDQNSWCEMCEHHRKRKLWPKQEPVPNLRTPEHSHRN